MKTKEEMTELEKLIDYNRQKGKRGLPISFQLIAEQAFIIGKKEGMREAIKIVQNSYKDLIPSERLRLHVNVVQLLETLIAHKKV